MTAGSHASAFADGAAYEAQLGPAHRHYIRVKARLLRRLIARHHPAASQLVDLGCGTGEMAAALADRPYKITGVDLSPAMIAYANAKGLRRATFVAADATRTGLPGASLDVAFATALYHHVPPDGRAAVARETFRIVRPGGLAIVFEHNPKNPITRRIVRSCPVDEGVVLLPRGETHRLLTDAGFEVIGERYLLFFPRPLALLSRLEPMLSACPVGGQYVVVARRPTAPSNGAASA